jgi:hypothetical protein
MNRPLSAQAERSCVSEGEITRRPEGFPVVR